MRRSPVKRAHGWRGPLRASAAVAVALMFSGAAAAQVAQEDGRILFEQAWFARFAPSHALDMAQQVPGFNLEDGEDVRGFAGAAGNVVINGARPSAKSETLAEILRRIPASQVVRMELAPGSLFGADYRSRPQVLNVVLVSAGAGTAISGVLELGLQHVYTGDVTPSGSGSILIRRGEDSFTGAFRYDARALPDEGYDILTLADGRLVERRDKFNQYTFRETIISAGWRWEGAGEASHGLNGRVWTRENPLRHTSAVSGPSGALRRDTIEQNPLFEGYEIGADIARPMLDGQGKLVLLARQEQFGNDEISLSRTPGGIVLGGFEQAFERTTGETLARATWSRSGWNGWSAEVGGETALNTLESEVVLNEVLPDLSRRPRGLPIPTVEVSEVRNELFVSGGRSLTSQLSLELGLAVENSTLAVEGGASAERTLTFLKPRAALEWRPMDGWRLKASLDRSVGQLNFSDFVTSAELANDRVTSGNADIEPERTWRASLLVERKFAGDGQATVNFFNDWVEQVEDRVPTALGFDAPGNLGAGRRIGFDATADLPLRFLGLPNGRLNFRWVVQDSAVEDPYTGEDRYFSAEIPWFFTATFRQNMPEHNLSWGVDYIADGANRNYRLNEIDTFNTENLNFGVFLEYRPTPKVVATVAVRNIFDRDIIRDRVFFSPDRRQTDPFATDSRVRNTGTQILLTVRRSFG